MPMVQIRIMRVRMAQGGMTVPVRMRLGHRAIVEMLMMIVMRMAMLVAYRLVPVFVLVAFRQVQPDARAHENRRNAKAHREGVP